MPHTSRKKLPSSRNKRTQIEDEDGWTTISSSTFKSRHRLENALPLRSPASELPPTGTQSQTVGNQRHPMEPDRGLTLETLRAKYFSIEKKWLASASFKELEKVLLGQALRKDDPVMTCVVFGTGSPSGSATWWIGRTDVAVYQLAVFQSVASIIERMSGKRPQCYAQEPCYNQLDISLLSSLQIEMVNHPQGFELLRDSRCAFAYAPGGELSVDTEILDCDPDISLGGKLDYFWRTDDGQPRSDRVLKDDETLALVRVGTDSEGMHDPNEKDERTEERLCKAGEAFLKSHRGQARLPNLDVNNFPFHQQHLYWRVNTT